MTQVDVATLRANKRFARQEYDKQMMQDKGASGDSFSDAGPPHWNRASWDAFKTRYGTYPYGNDGAGGFINPPTFAGAPDWVYDYMNLRKPPVQVVIAE